MSIKQPRFPRKILTISTIFFLVLVSIRILYNYERTTPKSNLPSDSGYLNITIQKLPTREELKQIWIKRKIERLSKQFKGLREDVLSDFEPLKRPFERVHIFYYLWYRNGEGNQISKHWSINKLFDENIVGSEDVGIFKGPGICFYPREGLYNSNNVTIMKIHLAEMKRSGIGVAVVHWQPPGYEDSPEDSLLAFMNVAVNYGVKVTLHISPYNNWSVDHLSQQLKSFLDSYGKHKGLYTIKKAGKSLPVFYIYDSMALPSRSWAKYLSPNSIESIRNSKFDGIFIGLLAEAHHKLEIKKSHFDGFYTYFAGNGDTYGSSWKNWKSLAEFARSNSLLFVPCVAPGYAEPLGGPINKPRLKGHYFEVGMRTAIDANPEIIAITSFNKWEEGTQIEPAVPRRSQSHVYMDYEPNEPTYYLNLIGWWVKSWWEKRNKLDVVFH